MKQDFKTEKSMSSILGMPIWFVTSNLYSLNKDWIKYADGLEIMTSNGIILYALLKTIGDTGDYTEAVELRIQSLEYIDFESCQ